MLIEGRLPNVACCWWRNFLAQAGQELPATVSSKFDF